MVNQSRSVAVPASGSISLGPLCLDPLKSLSVENAQVAMILLTVVPSKYVQFLIVESGSVILDGWGGVAFASCRLLL